MKVGIVQSSALGANCWSAARLLSKCLGCDKYDSCTYPDRRRDEYYDSLVRESREAHAVWQAALDKAKAYALGK